MADGPDPIDVLESQLTAITDTQGNLGGLIEKAAGIQADLTEAGHDLGLAALELLEPAPARRALSVACLTGQQAVLDPDTVTPAAGALQRDRC